ncbi:hypothetical protein C9J98_15915 [Stenotrophomonas panacihumi]|nr:hypothetical protein C9J98_15915 [Stenotrophomonas panacihumi]
MHEGRFAGLDVAWMAVDASGQLAVFTTGGEGPLPATAFASVDLVGPAIESLPESCGYHLVADVSRPDDFVAFAKRGFFAYDWPDVHRSAFGALRCYELQARPLRPATLMDLPAEMRLAAAATELSGVMFGDALIKGDAVIG